MKPLLLFILFTVGILNSYGQSELKTQVNKTLDDWHKAASEANYNHYFEAMSDDAIFIGTDASENWTKTDFQAYAQPHFDKGKAWTFKVLERNIYFNTEKTIAWFDELLDTQMKICRGSGVLAFENGQWKIKHYVLSMTIPNDTTDDVIKIKSPIEDSLITKLKKKKQ